MCLTDLSHINNSLTVFRSVYFLSALINVFFLLQVFVERRYIVFFKRNTLEMAVPDGEVGYPSINTLPFLINIACLGGLMYRDWWLTDIKPNKKSFHPQKGKRTLSLLVENCGRVHRGKDLDKQRKGCSSTPPPFLPSNHSLVERASVACTLVFIYYALLQAWWETFY